MGLNSVRTCAMASQPPTIDDILCAAIEISSPDQRATYLDEACGGDTDLRTQVDNCSGPIFVPAVSWNNLWQENGRRKS